ncbi:MAG: ImmA/IrrE family metallo-endopeptidase [Pseudolabrys sp.]|nr:ImmA/IrrE family metallo-endopeptidase [Pseudolabrys sp.]
MEAAEPNYVRAEARSFAVLQRFGIDAPNFEIRDVARGLDIAVKIGGVSGGDARIVKTKDGRGIIRLNSAITDPARQRFSIAHEIGHWEQHPNLDQGYLCTAADLRDYGRSAAEAEANWFAATLLMPKFLLPPDVFKQDPKLEFVRTFAKDFGTSLTAAARRFVELSNQPVVLVASNQGQVAWCAQSKTAKTKYYFLKVGIPIPPDSVTADVIRENATDIRSDKMAPNVWFPTYRFDREAELFEEVRYSPTYDGALTLLWIPG